MMGCWITSLNEDEGGGMFLSVALVTLLCLRVSAFFFIVEVSCALCGFSTALAHDISTARKLLRYNSEKLKQAFVLTVMGEGEEIMHSFVSFTVHK